MVKSGAEWPDSANYYGASFCCQCALASWRGRGQGSPDFRPVLAVEGLAVSRGSLRHSLFYRKGRGPERAGQHVVNPFSGLLG